jgi:hypothetical protein
MLGTTSWCLRRPSLLAWELLWRWAFGVPALYVAYIQLAALWQLVPQTTLNNLQASAYDPVAASGILLGLYNMLAPPVMHLLAWMLPAGLVAWAVVSGLGRWLVLRRLSALRADLLPVRPAFAIGAELIGFQALRIGGMAVTAWACYGCIHLAAAHAFADVQNPNLVLYASVVIVSVLGAFTGWALVSWTVTLAPLLLARRQQGFAAAARAGLRPGRRTTGKLMEINLVLGIVKLGLLVLAMVFSAIPLPFQEVTTPESLHIWWAIVSVAYLIANAFFQVVRLVATLETVDATA